MPGLMGTIPGQKVKGRGMPFLAWLGYRYDDKPSGRKHMKAVTEIEQGNKVKGTWVLNKPFSQSRTT